MRPDKFSPTLIFGGVNRGTIGENHPHTIDGFIAVLLNPTAHAAGIVGENTTDFGAINGGGIGSYLAIELG